MKRIMCLTNLTTFCDDDKLGGLGEQWILFILTLAMTGMIFYLDFSNDRDDVLS